MQKQSTHAQKLATLSPLALCNRSQNSATREVLFLWPCTLDLSFQKVNLSKHFLISDWSMTSCYAVSARSNETQNKTNFYVSDEYYIPFTVDISCTVEKGLPAKIQILFCFCGCFVCFSQR